MSLPIAFVHRRERPARAATSRSDNAESNVHDFAIYTSDSTNLLHRDNGFGKEPELSQEGLSNNPSFTNAPEPSLPSMEIEGYGIGL